MDEETQRKSRQRMQKKDNAPCNNQLKRNKRKEDKKGKLSAKKIVSQKSAFKRIRSNRIPKCLQKNRKQLNL
jgi:hypothetical protein